MKLTERGQKLEFQLFDGNGGVVALTFSLNPQRRRYDLVNIRRDRTVWSYDEAGYETLAEVPQPSTSASAPECKDSQTVGVSAQTVELAQASVASLVVASVPRNSGCSESEKKLVEGSVADIVAQGDGSKYFSCVLKHEPDTFATSFAFLTQPLATEKLSCSSSEAKSKAKVEESQIVLGSDFLSSKSLDARNAVLLHEVLHLSVGADEFAVDNLVKCCSGEPDSGNSCTIHKSYKDLMELYSKRETNGEMHRAFPAVAHLLSELSRSKLSEDQKKAITGQMKADYVSIHREYLALPKKAQTEAALDAYTKRAIEKYLSVCAAHLTAATCASIKAESYSESKFKSAKELMYLGAETSFAVLTAQREMRDNMGKTPAVSATTQGPPVPQNLEVRPPDANRLARVRDQMEEYSKPYRALTEQLGTATRSIVANIAPVSPAVASTRRTATTPRTSGGSTRTATIPASFTATVTSVKNEEFQIQMPDKTIASGWVPFTKDGYGTPQIKLTPPTGQIVGAGTLAQSDSDETTRSRKGSVPTRIPRESTTASTGGGGQTQAGGGGGVGGGGTSPTVTRSPSGGAGAQLDFSTARLKEISEIKLQLVRSAKPEEAIKARIPDLRRLSIQVYYNGEPYPADLQNPETTLDLNRYRGNR